MGIGEGEELLSGCSVKATKRSLTVRLVNDLSDSDDSGERYSFEELDFAQYYYFQLRDPNGKITRKKSNRPILGSMLQKVIEKNIALGETAYVQARESLI